MVSEKRSTRKEFKPTLALLKRFRAPLAYKLDLSSIVLLLHVIISLDSFKVNNRDFFLKPVGENELEYYGLLRILTVKSRGQHISEGLPCEKTINRLFLPHQRATPLQYATRSGREVVSLA